MGYSKDEINYVYSDHLLDGRLETMLPEHCKIIQEALAFAEGNLFFL